MHVHNYQRYYHRNVILVINILLTIRDSIHIIPSEVFEHACMLRKSRDIKLFICHESTNNLSDQLMVIINYDDLMVNPQNYYYE